MHIARTPHQKTSGIFKSSCVQITRLTRPFRNTPKGLRKNTFEDTRSGLISDYGVIKFLSTLQPDSSELLLVTGNPNLLFMFRANAITRTTIITRCVN